MPMEIADKINLIEDPLEFFHDFVDSNSLENITTLAHPRDSSRRREFHFQFSLFSFQFERFQKYKNRRSKSKSQ
jgi:hypothetical protein